MGSKVSSEALYGPRNVKDALKVISISWRQLFASIRCLKCHLDTLSRSTPHLFSSPFLYLTIAISKLSHLDQVYQANSSPQDRIKILSQLHWLLQNERDRPAQYDELIVSKEFDLLWRTAAQGSFMDAEVDQFEAAKILLDIVIWAPKTCSETFWEKKWFNDIWLPLFTSLTTSYSTYSLTHPILSDRAEIQRWLAKALHSLVKLNSVHSVLPTHVQDKIHPEMVILLGQKCLDYVKRGANSMEDGTASLLITSFSYLDAHRLDIRKQDVGLSALKYAFDSIKWCLEAEKVYGVGFGSGFHSFTASFDDRPTYSEVIYHTLNFLKKNLYHFAANLTQIPGCCDSLLQLADPELITPPLPTQPHSSSSSSSNSFSSHSSSKRTPSYDTQGYFQMRSQLALACLTTATTYGMQLIRHIGQSSYTLGALERIVNVTPPESRRLVAKLIYEVLLESPRYNIALIAFVISVVVEQSSHLQHEDAGRSLLSLLTRAPPNIFHQITFLPRFPQALCLCLAQSDRFSVLLPAVVKKTLLATELQLSNSDSFARDSSLFDLFYITVNQLNARWTATGNAMAVASAADTLLFLDEWIATHSR